MIQKLICALCVLLCYADAQAQAPRNAITHWTNPCFCSTPDYNASSAIKYQCCYAPSDFRGLQTGPIAAVYLRIGQTLGGSAKTAVYKGVKIKMGQLAAGDTSFPHVNGWDTFKTGLVTVVNLPVDTIKARDSVARWIKYPLNAGSFAIVPEQPFVFEISKDTFAAGSNGIRWNASNLMTSRRFLDGYRDSIRAYNSSSLFTLDLGFDLVTMDVKAFTNIPSFGLFPNPVTDGRVNVSFSARQSIREAVILVADATGRTLIEQRFANTGTELFQELNLGAATTGVYFLKLVADGETINRRLLIE